MTEGNYLNSTYQVKVGCGKLYVSILYDEKRRFKRIFIPRNSKFKCDLVTRDMMARTASFEGKRSLRQAIKDLKGSKGHHCDNYNVTCEAASCSDAVALALMKWLKVKRKRKKDTPPSIILETKNPQ